MKTLTDLILSTSSLEIFSQCPRLFRYRYLESDYFPIYTDAEQEQSIRLGNDFHRFVELMTPLPERQDWLDRLPPELMPWWRAFQRSGLAQPLGKMSAELPIWFTWRGQHLVVRLDRLLVTPDGKWQIWDWKTGKHRPSQKKIKSAWQFRLYPLALCLGGSALNDHLDINPDRVSMHFWFAQHADRPYHFTYAEQQFAEDKQHLEQTLISLQESAIKGFPKINNEAICSPCFFRHQCWGKHPIGMNELQLELFYQTDQIDHNMIADSEELA